jgi:CRISPR-associated endonuclease Csn1
VLHDIGYAEVDHALPYSRSFDDSKNNKVLVLAGKPQQGQPHALRIPDFGGARAANAGAISSSTSNRTRAYRLAKRSRLLRKDFGGKAAEEFRERNLNDTRYICRFFKNYVERFLQTLGATIQRRKRCVVLSGQTTAFLRARWGLLKVRSDSDRHHALDAAVVAACSHGMVKRLADYARAKNWGRYAKASSIRKPAKSSIRPCSSNCMPTSPTHGRISARTRSALHHRRCPELRARMEMHWAPIRRRRWSRLRPLFVSRAPQRRNSGAAHKDTIYAQPERLKEQGGVTQKVPLASLTLKDIDKLIDPHRNEKLYAAIRARLEAHGGKGDKAFPPDNPAAQT